MDISGLDISIIILYLVGIALIGSLSGGKQRSTRDYFMGGSNVPWWTVAFSIVAAETSSLTFISIPGLAYVSNLNFLQLTIGYVIARIIVAVFFLPAYKSGELSTAYAFLEKRFGLKTRRYASTVFLITRVAADGVRLFSTAIPLALIFKTSSFFDGWGNVSIYVCAIAIIAIVALVYTYTGGMKGVIWADAVQMVIYIGGALLSVYILLFDDHSSLVPAIEAGKTALFNFDFGNSITDFFTQPYTFISSIVGGTFLSMASHGTDQLIVQRLLSTKTLRDSQKAIIASGILVMLQFALFFLVGLLLYSFYGQAPVGGPAAPFQKADEIFPLFIIQHIPVGFKGIIIAGLFAAAISTLAGSISSLAGSATLDLFKTFSKKSLDNADELKISRLFTLVAALILIVVAFAFITLNQSVVEIALGIASITYGGLLGTFLLGLFFKNVDQGSAIIGFTTAIICMLYVSLYPVFTGKVLLHWTWYVLLGSVITILVGNLSYIFKNRLTIPRSF